MRKIVVAAALLLCVPVCLQAQSCDQTVTDDAHVLGGSVSVDKAARDLNAMGADVRVVTLGHLSGTLEQYVEEARGACSSWRSTSGGVKNNLIVFALAPNQRKYGIFYGGEWAAALEHSQNAIKTQFMAPAFRDGDWARGIAQGEQQVANQIKALNEAALHPQQTQVTEQATDLSGLWTVMGWLLTITAVGLAVWGCVYYVGWRRRTREALAAAQQAAMKAAAAVADEIQRRRTMYDTKTALGEKNEVMGATLDRIAVGLSRLASSSSYDPSVNGLSLSQYQAMERAYNRLLQDLAGLDISRPSTTGGAARREHRDRPQRPFSETNFGAGTAAPAAPQPTQVTTNTTIIQQEPAFIPVVETVYVPDPEPVRHSSWSAPSRSSYDDTSSSSSYGGGSSSSWSSSDSSNDSGSSSSFDSGSSSDFGGSSSDF
jgi:uncharacterized protein